MEKLPARKQNRLEKFDYGQNGAYFITVCTANRDKILWCHRRGGYYPPAQVPLSYVGRIVQQSLLQVKNHYPNVSVDKYCIMPDHVHFILTIQPDENGRIVSAPTVPTVVGSMKRWVSRQIGEPIWQKSYYDHVIRNQDDYDEVWQYIENNPLKYALTN